MMERLIDFALHTSLCENICWASRVILYALAAEQCLWWLKFRMREKVVISQSQPITPERVDEYQMLAVERGKQSMDLYANVCWVGYAYTAGELKNNGCLRFLLQNFLLYFDKPLSSTPEFAIWADDVKANPFYSLSRSRDGAWRQYDCQLESSLSTPARPLFVACAFGLPEIVTSLLRMIITCRPSLYKTPRESTVLKLQRAAISPK